MYDGVRKAPHQWGTSAATIERRTDMHEQLIKEIQKMVRDGEVPAKSVAEAVGKPYSTLMREINLMTRARSSAWRRSWRSSKPRVTPRR